MANDETKAKDAKKRPLPELDWKRQGAHSFKAPIGNGERWFEITGHIEFFSYWEAVLMPAGKEIVLRLSRKGAERACQRYVRDELGVIPTPDKDPRAPAYLLRNPNLH